MEVTRLTTLFFTHPTKKIAKTPSQMVETALYFRDNSVQNLSISVDEGRGEAK